MTLLRSPRIILFDWHGTLVDTNDAMYRAMDDMLDGIERLGLADRLADPRACNRDDDRALLAYVRAHHRLLPRVVSERRTSRTDLLEILFRGDEEAKQQANAAYNACYRNHFGDVKPLAPGIRDLLSDLCQRGVRLGILTNRAREFLDRELATVDGGTWAPFFDDSVSGDDCAELKPSPAPVLRALRNFGAEPATDVWYVGDSTSDTIAAKTAGVASIFFKGGRGDAGWVESLFPGTAAFPHRPDRVIEDHRELLALVKSALVGRPED